VKIAVLGSVNLDLVASGAHLPRPGETVTAASLTRHPGGKGANQALAARRLGADVRLIARVGRDGEADAALTLLRAEGVDLSACSSDERLPTGTALIVVAADGENQIVVVPGANDGLRPEHLEPTAGCVLLCQMEIPAETIAAAAAGHPGFFALNLAPALPVPPDVLARADLIIVNAAEAQAARDLLAGFSGLLAVTYGADGAAIYRGGEELARAGAPRISAVDSTGAGDAFSAALVLQVAAGADLDDALAFACAAGACAATRRGAQPSLPTAAEVAALYHIGSSTR